MGLGSNILEALKKMSSGLTGTDQGPTGMDLYRMQQPADPEATGFWGTLNKVNRQISGSRIGEEQLRQARETHEADIGQKKAQTEYYGAGSQQRLASARYNDARANIQGTLAQIKADKLDWEKYTDEASLNFKYAQEKRLLDQAAQAIKESENRILNMTDDNARAQAQLELDRQKQEYKIKQDEVENGFKAQELVLSRGRLDVSQGQLEVNQAGQKTQQQSVNQQLAPRTVITQSDSDVLNYVDSDTGQPATLSKAQVDTMRVLGTLEQFLEKHGLNDPWFGGPEQIPSPGTMQREKTTTTTRVPAGTVHVIHKESGEEGYKRPPIDTEIYEVLD